MSHLNFKPRGRALLIGINSYPLAPPRAQLQGCVKDLGIAQQVLAEVFELSSDDITVLRDEKATRQAILEAMESLVEKTLTDEAVYFHFSGHGRRIQAPESPSGYFEAIVPSDSGTSPHPNRDILDYEIADWIRRLEQKESRLVFVFDSCFSGSIARGPLDESCRGLEEETRDLDLPTRWSPVAGEPAKSRGLLSSIRSRQVLFTACAADQFAREIGPPENENGKSGVFSYFFYRELSVSRSRTFRELFDKVGTAVSALLPQQNPQLEGAIDLEIHGQETVRPEPFVLVRSCQEDSVLLAGGVIHGITPGSEWTLEPPGSLSESTRSELSPVASIVRILDADTLESHAKLIRRNPNHRIEAGWRAFLYRTTRDFRLPVYLVPSPALVADSLATKLSAMSCIRLVSEPQGADLTIWTIEARGQTSPENLFPELGAFAEAHFVVRHRDGSPLGRALPVSGSRTIEIIAENLQKRARFLNLLTLNPIPIGEAQLQIGGTLLGRRIDSQWLPIQSAAGIRIGERLGFRLENGSKLPIFPYVFFLGWESEIVPMFPSAVGGHEALDPGRRLDIGTGHVHFTLTPSKDQQYSGPRQGFVKVIAATRPVGVDQMVQDGFRSRGNGADDPLESLFELAFGLETTSSPRPMERKEDVEWTTWVAPFLVLP